MRKIRHGFTLLELLVVVAIIAVLIGVLLPALSGAKQTSMRSVCGSNLRQIGSIWTQYALDNDDYFPPSYHGGFWSPLYKINKEYFDNGFSVDGEIFFCPTHKQRIRDSGGEELGWDNLIDLGPFGEAVLTSYNYWTNFLTNPQRGFWDPVDCEIHNFWPCWLVENEISKPWLVRLSDAAVAEKRIAWDEIYFNLGEFTPQTTRHMRGNKVDGANGVYGDGHVDWIPFERMVPIPQSSVYINYF